MALYNVNGVMARSLGCKKLPTVGAYGEERHLKGWFVVHAIGYAALLHPATGHEEWLYTEEGIPVPAGDHRVLYFDDENLGYYIDGRGEIRLERIEPMIPMERVEVP